MSVALASLVTSIKLEVSPPGTDLYPGTTDDEWIGRLANGFWNARIDGMLAGYVEADGEVFPESGTTDMPRDLQQVIVFVTAYGTVFQKLLNIRTQLKAKAGPVEFETQNSATVLRDLAQSLRDRYAILLRRLSDLGMVPDYVIDGIMARTDALVNEGRGWTG